MTSDGTGTADDFESGLSSPADSATIYPLVTGDGNRRVLREWLSTHDIYRVVDAEVDLEAAEFDLCIVDQGGLKRHADKLRRIKAETKPVLFPVLLLLPERQSEIIETDRGEIADNVFGTTIDEIVSLPIRQAELEWRIQALLRLRDQSLALQDRTDQLHQFKKAVEASGHAVYITDPEGTIEYVNPAFEELTGYDREEAVGRTPNILHSGEMPPSYFEELWETVLSGAVWEEEVIDRRKDGELYTAYQTISPITDGDDVTALVAVQVDITELKDVHRQLRVVDRILRHNLRNDLTVIRGQAERVRTDVSGELADAADEMIGLVDDLLTTSEKSRAITDVLSEQPDSQRIDIADVVRRIASAADADSSARIDVDVPDQAIASATTNVHEAIEELVKNAINHNGTESPSVSLSVTVNDQNVVVTVADNGPGIPEMDRAVLAAGDAIDDLYHGSGLGLWLVYWIVNRSGGSIAVGDIEPRGTRVTVSLPRDEVTTPATR
ncbi:PAS domain S-box protein [Salinadaptatus halalkaliphilus]|uniref:histidine kinase n=1 Tax=Salinadaptatus halalkaliphilus TaxID=2419781 RepID=A0A4S3TMM2_9EURY|nr:HAMP domain-containing sensor histidine kinase [Salinadaptatus halalkaliphilus]THE65396.1 PAS domain S-box protein [Salinadaptatus halalkaliphilus]